MVIGPVKGFKDFIGEEAKKREFIIDLVKRNFKLYGFEPAETPIIEYEDFVVGQNSDDDAVRDIFRLKDRGERNLALRYEFTFQLKRISKNQKLPFKRYQIGYNFRDEPIRKGRLRQFMQCDADIIGSTIKDEAEILSIANRILSQLKIPFKIYVNSRKLINEILSDEKVPEKDMPYVIREIDKLDKLSRKEVADNLKSKGYERILNLFLEDENFYQKYNFYKDIKELRKYSKYYGFDIHFRPFLSRGLSYYNGNVFEIWSEKLNVSISGGGSYLVNGVQSTGISLGLEPIFLLSNEKSNSRLLGIISIGMDKEAISLAEKLRTEGFETLLILDKGVSKAVEYANSRSVDYVIFVGENEVSSGKYKIKDMKSGEERYSKLDDISSQISKF